MAYQTRNLHHVLRELLSICTYAVHGEEVTEIQISLVTKNADKVLSYLEGVRLEK